MAEKLQTQLPERDTKILLQNRNILSVTKKQPPPTTIDQNS